MGRPPKPYAVLAGEGKSHRTKAELEARKQGEAALATGETLKEKPETKANITAHREFLRLKKLLTSIGKFDAIYENVINRYCVLYAECREFEEMRGQLLEGAATLEEDKARMLAEGRFSLTEYWKLKSQLQKNMLDLDRQIQAKRKMLMDIERENIMTIASTLRNIPKKEDKGENPILEVLRGG